MRFRFYIIIFIFILSSCENDEPGKIVMAGVSDSDMVSNEFDPSLQINFESDSLLNFKYGTDSIDLNLDGRFDLIISQRFFIDWNDSIRIVDNNFPFCKLTLKEGLEVAKKNEVYYIGLGQTSSVNWVDTIKFESRIDNIADWTITNTSIWMWVIPPTSFWGSCGCWYNLVNAERYIGIRMKVDSYYKYGWIKVNQINRENIEFVSYAIEK